MAIALPSGYTHVDYIESDGTQYIDTGFTPNQDTGFVVDFEVTSAEGSNGLCIIGARTNYNTNNLSFVWDLDGSWWMRNYGTLHENKYTATSPMGHHKVNASKTTVEFDGVQTYATAATFTCPGNLYLFALNDAGTANFFIKAKLYYCQIHDNGKLVRHFIPCMNSSGVLGLWEDVNSVFYPAASGTFASGKCHRTLINGTGYDIKSGRTLIGGTGYDIKKGRTLINGTGYDIKFDTPVGELDVGTSVYMNVDSVRKEFIVVHQGNPDMAKYDASCNGTWVLQKQLFFIGTGTAQYATDSSFTYQNGSYIGLLDEDIQALIKTVKIPYMTVGSGGLTGYPTGADGLSAKVFSPSYTELGGTAGSESVYNGADVGAKLDYFISGDLAYSEAAYKRRMVNTADEYAAYWVRHPVGSGNPPKYVMIDSGGQAKSGHYTGNYYWPMMFILPSDDALVDDEFNVIPA